MRITFTNSNQVDRNTTELELLFNGEKVKLQKDVIKSWVQNGGETIFDPELIQAPGRSLSLRLSLQGFSLCKSNIDI